MAKPGPRFPNCTETQIRNGENRNFFSKLHGNSDMKCRNPDLVFQTARKLWHEMQKPGPRFLNWTETLTWNAETRFPNCTEIQDTKCLNCGLAGIFQTVQKLRHETPKAGIRWHFKIRSEKHKDKRKKYSFQCHFSKFEYIAQANHKESKHSKK